MHGRKNFELAVIPEAPQIDGFGLCGQRVDHAARLGQNSQSKNRSYTPDLDLVALESQAVPSASPIWNIEPTDP